MLTRQAINDILQAGREISNQDYVAHFKKHESRTVYLMAKALTETGSKWRYLSYEDLQAFIVAALRKQGVPPTKDTFNPVDWISAEWTESEKANGRPSQYFRPEYKELFDRENTKNYDYRIKPQHYDTVCAILEEADGPNRDGASPGPAAEIDLNAEPLAKEPGRLDSMHPAAPDPLNPVAIQTVELEGIARNIDYEQGFLSASLDDARLRDLRAVVLRRGQPAFRSALIGAYGGRCAITGCDGLPALEAAHIIPYRGQHTNEVRNGILLRGDIHTLFDLHFIAIEPHSGLVRIGKQLLETTYRHFDGMMLRAPNDRSKGPDRECLEWRWKMFQANFTAA